MLRDLGHKVMVARSGKEALEIVGKHGEPELLITDQAMPGMTGVQLAAELLSRVPDIRVIVATGYADLPNSNSEFTLLNKPYSQEELAGAIANAMSFH